MPHPIFVIGTLKSASYIGQTAFSRILIEAASRPLTVKILVWAYKMGRERARRMDVYRGEFASMHPKFPSGSKAAITEGAHPVAMNAPDIQYSAADDVAIEEYI